MKKTLTRAMSLLLVLVMLLGVVPMAAADNLTGNHVSLGSDVSMGLSAVPSGGIALTPSVTAGATSGYSVNSYAWTVSGGSGASLTSTTGATSALRVTTAGTYTVTLSVTFTSTANDDEVVSDSMTVTVTDDTVKVTSVTFASQTYNLVVGGTEHLTPQVKPDNATDDTLNYTVGDSSVISMTMDANGKFATITGLKAGTTTITATAADGSGKSDTATVIVTAPAKNGLAVTGGSTVKVGEELTLTAAALPAGAELASDATYTWNVSLGTGSVTKKTNSTGSSLTIVGGSVGTVSVTVSDGTHTSQPFTVTVEESDETYTVAMKPATLALTLGETSTALAVEVKNSENVVVSEGVTTANWASSATDVAALSSDHKVIASSTKTGTANITCDVLVDGTKVGTATCAVTVSGSALTCENTSVAVGGSVTLEPILRFGTTAATNVQYTFTETSNTYATVTSAGRVSSNRAELVKVAVDVTSYTLNGTTVTASGANDIAPIEVLVRFYVTPDIDLTVAEGVTGFDLEDTKVFSKATVDGVTLSNPGNRSFADVFGTTVSDSSVQTSNYNTMHFSHIPASSAGYICDSKGDTLSSAYWSFLESVQFRQRAGRTGTTSFTVTMKDTNGLIVSNAKVTINVVGGEGDINYETDYKTAIKFDKTDFTKFWNNHEDDFKRDLAYVKFDVSTLIGSLYTDSTKKTEVKSSSYIAVADLSKLYYVPVSNKTTEYIDSMSFTAYDQYRGVSSGEYTIGNLTITLNATSNEISSRGLVLGTKYARNLADVYHTNTNKQLGYVVFDLPQAKYGKMYSSLPTVGGYTKVADGVALKATDKLYYDPSNSQLSLAKAAFIPAAGYNGEVELSYTAYDVNGGNLYAGVLRLDVVTKTASSVFTDITKTKYSWAADSADFLYYEGTAQGSNGKYNPKANITRQDFMLMLYRAFLADDYNTFVVSTNFPDVVKGTTDYSKEIYQAVGVAKYLGIAQGTNERFNPKSNITRQEAMVLIYRTLNTIDRDLEYTSGVKASSFKDYSKISSWATEAISNLVGHGVILGTNEKINPSSNITRAEMACILHRVITY